MSVKETIYRFGMKHISREDIMLFLCGLFIGGIVGFFTAILMVAAKRRDTTN